MEEEDITIKENPRGFSKKIIFLFVFLLIALLYVILKIGDLSFLGEQYANILNPYLNILENGVIVLLVFSLTYLFITSTKKLIKSHLERIGRSKRNVKLFLTVYDYLIWILAIFITFSLIFKQIGSLVTSIGLIGFGLTLALQKPILNFVGWTIIIFGKMHQIGDVISINGITGKVYDIKVMYTLVSEMNSDGDSTGKSISIPNEFVFIYPVTNFSRGTDYVWDSITINITYKSNWKKAMGIVERTVQDYYDKKIKKGLKGIFKNNFKDYEKIGIRFGMHEKGLYIRARYMVDFNNSNEVKKELTGILLNSLKKRDIFLGKVENVS